MALANVVRLDLQTTNGGDDLLIKALTDGGNTRLFAFLLGNTAGLALD